MEVLVLLERLRYQSRDARSGTGLGKDAGVGTSVIKSVGADPGLERVILARAVLRC